MHIVALTHGGSRVAGVVSDGQVRLLLDGGRTVAPEALFPRPVAEIGALEHGDALGALDEVAVDLPVARPGKIICVGLNYRDHALEGGHQIPDYPALFMRGATSLVPHGQAMLRPGCSEKFDYEAELAIVIGRSTRHALERTALDAVFGYTIFNDGSIRDYQRRSAQWTAGKNFDRTGGLGPAIVTADALPPGAAGLAVRARVGGETLQDGNTSEMIFPVARIIEILSEIMTLEPGDLIATGTPAGVGFARKPPRWLKDGDLCEIEIEGIGTLRNPIRDDPDFPAATAGAAR